MFISIRKLSHGDPPKPRKSLYKELASGVLDSTFVEVEGSVRSIINETPSHMIFTVEMLDGKLNCYIYGLTETNVTRLIGSRVRLRGALGGSFNQRRQLLAPRLFVNGMENIFLESPAPRDPFDVPITRVENLRQYSASLSQNERVRVRGVVTYQQPGRSFFIRDGNDGLQLQTFERTPVSPGDLVEAIGFSRIGVYTPFLEDVHFKKVGEGGQSPPWRCKAGDLLKGDHDADLVTVDGELLDFIRRDDEQILVMQADGAVFNAHLQAGAPNAAPVILRKGSFLQLTGVCIVQGTEDLGATLVPSSFSLLLRGPGDVHMLRLASWWTGVRLLYLLAASLLSIVAALIWVWFLRRKVREQTALIGEKLRREAVLEERTRLAREIHDSLEQELAGISMQLDTAAAKFIDAPEVAQKSLEFSRQLIKRSQSEVHHSIWNLRSPTLEEEGLAGAIAKVVEPLSADSSCTVNLEVADEFPKLPAVLENHLLRIAQEAVNNAIKHGKARQIDIELESDAKAVTLRVRDNGCGFDAACQTFSRGLHFGLQGMKERARKLGGQISIRSSPGSGTDIEFTLVLKNGYGREE